MAIPYKKQFVKSDGRKLNRSGPRDMQARTVGGGYTADNSVIELLTNQLTELRAEILAMKSRSGDAAPAGFFSPEQVDREITKAVEEAAIFFNKNSDLVPIVREYKTEVLDLQKANENLTRLHSAISKENTTIKDEMKRLQAELGNTADLKKQIAVLEQEVLGKQELISILKTRPAIVDGEIITDPDRPQMEQVFIDPLEEDAGKGMKASIQIKTVVKDEEVGDKVNKLKDLLGSKLPTK